MHVEHKTIWTPGYRFAVSKDGEEIGCGYLYLLRNDFHNSPYGFMEDVFIRKDRRGEGFGTMLISVMISSAREHDCYKLVAMSRYENTEAQRLYKKMGFIEWGKEFRLDLS